MTIKYKLKTTNSNSSKYGNCECCDKTVSEVYYLYYEREYTRPDNTKGFTTYNCDNKFGHEQCLKNHINQIEIEDYLNS